MLVLLTHVYMYHTQYVIQQHTWLQGIASASITRMHNTTRARSNPRCKRHNTESWKPHAGAKHAGMCMHTYTKRYEHTAKDVFVRTPGATSKRRITATPAEAKYAGH